jgi:hypothetical protein
MDAKQLFFSAIDHFKKRNAEVLPQLQLQKCRNERWFARELALAMNRHLTSTWSPTALPLYADCEENYADISVWESGPDVPRTRKLVYELKTIYRSLDGGKASAIDGIVARAREQLALPSVSDAARRFGLFLIIYDRRADDRGTRSNPSRLRVRSRHQTDRVVPADCDPILADWAVADTELDYVGRSRIVSVHARKHVRRRPTLGRRHRWWGDRSATSAEVGLL